MEPELAIQEFLEFVVVQLIQHPESASVLHDVDDDRHLYRIRLHPDDAGRVIGRNGKTISAIRTLLNAISVRDGRKAVFEVIE